MKIKMPLTKSILALIMMISLVSCSKEDGYDQQDPGNLASSVNLINTTTFGNILSDKNGRTLYSFAVDAAAQSNCNGGCAVTWPAFYDPNLTLGAGLKSSDFGVITRADNSKQNTYKGWPLYYYSGDAKVGDTKGDGLSKTWFVAKPDYTVMIANQQLVGADGISYNSQYKAGAEIVQYITDDYGRTLYSFIKDKAKVNTYTNADFSNDSIWPIDQVAKVLSVPSILDKSKFAVITVFGKTQLTFNGWPLYYFGKDASVKGSNKGVSVGPGAWPVENTTTPAAPIN